MAERDEAFVTNGNDPGVAVAAAKADPFPDNPAGQLRNCSVNAWVDMTKWRVQVSDG